MKTYKMLFAALLIVALAAISVPSFADESTATETGHALAAIITAIGITKTMDLNFGPIINTTADLGSGTVSIAPTVGAERTAVGATDLLTSAHGWPGKFNVTGLSDATFTVVATPTTNSYITTGDGSGATKQMPYTLALASSTGVITGGAVDIYVGGTLTVAATNVAGNYTGDFTVQVDYN